jgi:hypothetical protein
MTPEARGDYERFILSDRPKYIPMKPEKLAKLSPEDRHEYENSLKIFLTISSKVVSSTNFHILLSLIFKSFIIIINSHGPNLVP